MKKLITISVLLASFSFSSAFAGMKYECWRYKNGKPDAYTNITANSKSEAENIGCAKEGRYCKCH